MKLSVIIVNYNVRYFLEQAVRSALHALQEVEGELIVVDNASSDDSQDMMRSTFPEVNYIYLDENLGFSKANNHGIKASKGEYVLLLNPDTVVAEDAFKKCVDFMDSHPEAGGLGVHMIDGSGNFLPESKRGLPTPRAAFYKIFGLSSLFPKSKRFGRYHLGYLDKEEVHEVDILSGAFMMMRKKALDKAGLLDESFFMYGEDIDLSYRLVKAGYKNYYFPGSRIIHYKGESTKKGSVNYVFVFYRAMVIFAKKHFDKGQASLFGFLIELAIYFRAGLAIVRRLFGSLWQAAIDGALVYGIFTFATHWYGDMAQKQFDLPFIQSVLLGYTALTVIVLLYAGAYDKGFRYVRLFQGWAFAVLALLGFYSLLPETYRFSRAVLLMGSAGAFLSTLLWRWLIYLVRPPEHSILRGDEARIGVVGNVGSLQEVRSFFEQHRIPKALVCGIGWNESTAVSLGFVGSLDELPSIAEDFRLTDVVFDTRLMSDKDMIQSMEACARLCVRFRMVLGDPMFLVGSQEAIGQDDRIASGELEQVNTESVRRIKRTLDVFLSLIFLPLSPILLFLVDNRLGFIKNLFRVLFGQRSWSGYDPRGKHPALPPLKKGVTYPMMNVILPSSAYDQCVQENASYIKRYNLINDLKLIFRHLHELGNDAG